MDIRIKTFKHSFVRDRSDFNLDERVESWKRDVNARILSLQVSTIPESETKYSLIVYTITYVISTKKKLLVEMKSKEEEIVE